MAPHRSLFRRALGITAAGVLGCALFGFAPAAQSLSFSEIASQPAVLGSVTYAPVTLTSPTNKSLTVKIQAVSFQNGKWTYELTWVRTLDRQGSLYVDSKDRTHKALDRSPAERSGTVSLQLLPGARYRVEFYTRPGKSGTLLLRKFFNTLGADGNPVALDQLSTGGPSASPSTQAVAACRAALKVTPGTDFFVNRNTAYQPKPIPLSSQLPTSPRCTSGTSVAQCQAYARSIASSYGLSVSFDANDLGSLAGSGPFGMDSATLVGRSSNAPGRWQELLYRQRIFVEIKSKFSKGGVAGYDGRYYEFVKESEHPYFAEWFKKRLSQATGYPAGTVYQDTYSYQVLTEEQRLLPDECRGLITVKVVPRGFLAGSGFTSQSNYPVVRGGEYTVKWTTPASTKKVSIYLMNGSTPVGAIAEHIANTGSYDFTWNPEDGDKYSKIAPPPSDAVSSDGVLWNTSGRSGERYKVVVVSDDEGILGATLVGVESSKWVACSSDNRPHIDSRDPVPNDRYNVCTANDLTGNVSSLGTGLTSITHSYLGSVLYQAVWQQDDTMIKNGKIMPAGPGHIYNAGTWAQPKGSYNYKPIRVGQDIYIDASNLKTEKPYFKMELVKWTDNPCSDTAKNSHSGNCYSVEEKSWLIDNQVTSYACPQTGGHDEQLGGLYCGLNPRCPSWLAWDPTCAQTINSGLNAYRWRLPSDLEPGFYSIRLVNPDFTGTIPKTNLMQGSGFTDYFYVAPAHDAVVCPTGSGQVRTVTVSEVSSTADSKTFRISWTMDPQLSCKKLQLWLYHPTKREGRMIAWTLPLSSSGQSSSGAVVDASAGQYEFVVPVSSISPKNSSLGDFLDVDTGGGGIIAGIEFRARVADVGQTEDYLGYAPLNYYIGAHTSGAYGVKNDGRVQPKSVTVSQLRNTWDTLSTPNPDMAAVNDNACVATVVYSAAKSGVSRSASGPFSPSITVSPNANYYVNCDFNRDLATGGIALPLPDCTWKGEKSGSGFVYTCRAPASGVVSPSCRITWPNPNKICTQSNAPFSVTVSGQ